MQKFIQHIRNTRPPYPRCKFAMMIITSSSMYTITWMSEKMVCRNFLFHTPLPKASIQQVLNEEKVSVIILISTV